MEAKLFSNKPFCFHLKNVFLPSQGSTQMGEVEVVVGAQDLGGSGEDSSKTWTTALYQLKDFLEGQTKKTDNWKKSLKINFSSASTKSPSPPTKLEVRMEGYLLREISKLFGSDVRIQLEVQDAQRKPGILKKQQPLSLVESRKVSFSQHEGPGTDDKVDVLLPPSPVSSSSSGELSVDISEPETSPLSPEQEESKLWQGSEMAIISMNSDTKACCEGDIDFPDNWKDHWCASSAPGDLLFTAKANLILSIPQPIVVSTPPPAAETKTSSSRTNDKADPMIKRNLLRVLHEELDLDVKIFAKDGKVVKCHSAFLDDHSKVLKKMLDKQWERSETPPKFFKIAMPDVREKVVRAFVDFLYCRDTQGPKKSVKLAVDLFQVAHKYRVNCLEDKIKSILLEKPDTWFYVNSTLRLFFFVDKLDKHQDLRAKAVEVLKSKPSEMMACKEYQNLFQVEEEEEEEKEEDEEKSEEDEDTELEEEEEDSESETERVCTRCNERCIQLEKVKRLFDAILSTDIATPTQSETELPK